MTGERGRLRATRLIAAALLVSTLLPPGAASGQEWECRMCPARRVAVFGVAVPPLSSDPRLDSAQHLRMKSVDYGIWKALLRDDPSRECLELVEHQVESDWSVADQFRYGFDPILPPGGPIDSTDYLMTGEISATGEGSYLLAVRVEAGMTREEVASVVVPYDLSAGGYANGEAATRQLIPLMGKIREFERGKRDTNAGMAIGDPGVSEESVELEVLPDKRFISTGETVGATVRLTDCDDVRLENKIVATTATGGHLVGETMPTTDDQGEMRVSFTHDEKATRGIISADFPFVRPFGREARASETGEVYVRDGGLVAKITSSYRMTERYPLERDMSTREFERRVARSSGTETIELEVFMRFDPKAEEVIRDFDAQKRTLVPQRYFYKRTSYEVSHARHEGTDTGFSSTHSVGSLSFMRDYSAQHTGELSEDRSGNETLVIDVDADGNVTRVLLPTVEVDFAVASTSKCTRLDKGEMIDCSDTWESVKSFHTEAGTGGEDDCYEVATSGGVEISGGCRRLLNEDGNREEVREFRWSLLRLRPEG